MCDCPYILFCGCERFHCPFSLSVSRVRRFRFMRAPFPFHACAASVSCVRRFRFTRAPFPFHAYAASVSCVLREGIPMIRNQLDPDRKSTDQTENTVAKHDCILGQRSNNTWPSKQAEMANAAIVLWQVIYAAEKKARTGFCPDDQPASSNYLATGFSD